MAYFFFFAAGFFADLDAFAVLVLAFDFTFVEDTFITVFFLGEAVFGFLVADAFTLPFFFPFSVLLCPFALALEAATNLSTVQPMLTETTSSPGFTSTITSPLVAARLRIPAASSRVDFGAPLVRWIVAM